MDFYEVLGVDKLARMPRERFFGVLRPRKMRFAPPTSAPRAERCLAPKGCVRCDSRDPPRREPLVGCGGEALFDAF